MENRRVEKETAGEDGFIVVAFSKPIALRFFDRLKGKLIKLVRKISL